MNKINKESQEGENIAPNVGSSVETSDSGSTISAEDVQKSVTRKIFSCSKQSLIL